MFCESKLHIYLTQGYYEADTLKHICRPYLFFIILLHSSPVRRSVGSRTCPAHSMSICLSNPTAVFSLTAMPEYEDNSFLYSESIFAVKSVLPKLAAYAIFLLSFYE